MELLIKDVKGVFGVGACNFCKKHTLSKNGHGLDYPYHEVIEIKSLSACMRICKDCFNDLITSKPIREEAPTS